MIDPNALLGSLGAARDGTTPCIMASGSDTRAPMIMRVENEGVIRRMENEGGTARIP